MEKRIDLERRGLEPAAVKNLNLDNTRATQIEGLTEAYTSLYSLSMINVGLTSLKGLPKLSALERLELSDNRISNGLDILLGCPKLTHVNLSGNKIKDLDALEPLKNLDHLTHLDLFNNAIEGQDDIFRNKVFKMLPNLQYLDGIDIDNQEDEDSDLENGLDDEDDEDVEEGEGEGDDDDDEEDGEGEEEEDDGDKGPGLADIYGDNLDDDEDGADYDETADQDEEDDESGLDEEESEHSHGKRRKLDDGGDGTGTA
ncbi:acidic leucine-rich nuclear phosphoprotein 32 family member B-like [Tigriopus californicus]|uniref:acidic leucine-rich nuclear phosphoprotein 32 family member B-like n=1 Tax=Tigriopus californicus TaxID=6832 RepID=UPI0027D9E2F2|nr:acidic leucine-rich nuclear phosphoprotein 32 family member B-like [Tigriopus californicus]XP_059091528.1 acidic leucine-rich nuclear phosphoprotein 32 family member B-like [Tigriopus californicus]